MTCDQIVQTPVELSIREPLKALIDDLLSKWLAFLSLDTFFLPCVGRRNTKKSVFGIPQVIPTHLFLLGSLKRSSERGLLWPRALAQNPLEPWRELITGRRKLAWLWIRVQTGCRNIVFHYGSHLLGHCVEGTLEILFMGPSFLLGFLFFFPASSNASFILLKIPLQGREEWEEKYIKGLLCCS